MVSLFIITDKIKERGDGKMVKELLGWMKNSEENKIKK
jgi:hypothetical protein